MRARITTTGKLLTGILGFLIAINIGNSLYTYFTHNPTQVGEKTTITQKTTLSEQVMRYADKNHNNNLEPNKLRQIAEITQTRYTGQRLEDFSQDKLRRYIIYQATKQD